MLYYSDPVVASDIMFSYHSSQSIQEYLTPDHINTCRSHSWIMFKEWHIVYEDWNHEINPMIQSITQLFLIKH